MRRLPIVAVLLLVAAMLLPGRSALAQEGPGGLINPGRDCQTVVSCRFTKGGSYRGCISAYSCRVCRLVSSRCAVGTAGRTCRAFRCSWGA